MTLTGEGEGERRGGAGPRKEDGMRRMRGRVGKTAGVLVAVLLLGALPGCGEIFLLAYDIHRYRKNAPVRAERRRKYEANLDRERSLNPERYRRKTTQRNAGILMMLLPPSVMRFLSVSVSLPYTPFIELGSV